MIWDKGNKKICVGDLVIAELSRYTQNYQEDWMLIPIEKPFTILRYIGRVTYENLDCSKRYDSDFNKYNEINELCVSDFFLFMKSDEYSPIDQTKMQLLSIEVGSISSHSDETKKQIRHLKS